MQRGNAALGIAGTDRYFMRDAAMPLPFLFDCRQTMNSSRSTYYSSAGERARALLRRVWTPGFTCLWLLGISWGMSQMMHHEYTPGALSAPVMRWPTGAAVERPGDVDYTVVMLAHPRCPCTRASLLELARLQAQAGSRTKACVFFMLPASGSDEWRQAPNWKLAAAIPGVQVLADPDGRQASLFGARTSGQTLIYDRAGILRFRGGLTGSRGQEGDNPACAAALRLICEGVPPAVPLPVFGCPLREPSESFPLADSASSKSLGVSQFR